MSNLFGGEGEVRPPETLVVSFHPELRTDGELIRLTLRQGCCEVQLTKEQALSLVGQIKGRLHV